MTKKKITIICYNQVEYWNSRAAAKKFFRECMDACEGCERERYANIFFDLLDGKDVCEDGCSWDLEELIKRGQVLNVGTPDGTRDYGGVIHDPIWD